MSPDPARPFVQGTIMAVEAAKMVLWEPLWALDSNLRV